MNFICRLLLIMTVMALAAPALAQPVLKIEITAETEREELVDGRKVIRTVPAEDVSSGQVVIYTLKVVNSGDQPATGVKVTDPVPDGTAFIAGSVFGDRAEVSYSIDGGRSYKQPSLLTYQADRGDGTLESRVATPEQYTHIRWVLETVPAGSSRSVGFRALVK